MSQNDEQWDKPRRRVVEWKTLEVLYKGQEPAHKSDISLSVEIKQPVFEDGSHGYPKLEATLNRGERFLRFTCFDGDVSELRAIHALIGDVERIGFGRFQDAYDEHISEYKNIGNAIDGERKHDGHLGGARFSRMDNGRYRRRRRGEEWR